MHADFLLYLVTGIRYNNFIIEMLETRPGERAKLLYDHNLSCMHDIVLFYRHFGGSDLHEGYHAWV